MSVLGDMYRGTNRFDFGRVWRVTLPLAAAVAVAALVLVATRGFSLSIDFEGGGTWEVPVDDVTVAGARDALAEVGLADARIQLIEDPDGQTYLRVQAGTDDLDRQDEITAAVAEVAGTEVDEVAATTVGPTWGDEITRQAVRATIYFFVAVSLYLSWRLEWRMAAGAMAAVVHDLALTAGIYSLFGFEVTPATVIALLTILGYSLYDTVVVYDKIREHQATAAKGSSRPYAQLVSDSSNQVLMRSLNTTISTLIPVVSMLIVGTVLLGGATLRDFSLALFVGLLAGAYSSIFVAAPLLVVLHGRDLRRPGRRQGATRRSPSGRSQAASDGQGGETTARPAAGARAASGSGPRPRKRRQP